jgi:hypothetical protein
VQCLHLRRMYSASYVSTRRLLNDLGTFDHGLMSHVGNLAKATEISSMHMSAQYLSTWPKMRLRGRCFANRSGLAGISVDPVSTIPEAVSWYSLTGFISSATCTLWPSSSVVTQPKDTTFNTGVQILSIYTAVFPKTASIYSVRESGRLRSGQILEAVQLKPSRMVG